MNRAGHTAFFRTLPPEGAEYADTGATKRKVTMKRETPDKTTQAPTEEAAERFDQGDIEKRAKLVFEAAGKPMRRALQIDRVSGELYYGPVCELRNTVGIVRLQISEGVDREETIRSLEAFSKLVADVNFQFDCLTKPDRFAGAVAEATRQLVLSVACKSDPDDVAF